MSPLLVVIVLCGLSACVSGHGRMTNPPGRSNAWRHGFKTLPNYNDMGLNCGGFANQFNTHGGKCGVCGDPYEQKQPRDNELGGKYGTGLIVKSYRKGEEITVDIDITANHMGYFEFRLCPDPQGIVTHDCLNRHLLETDQGTRWQLPDKANRVFQVRIKLPPSVMCRHCVLQWLYNAGNSWGDGGLGNGNQENFVNCADISIGSGNLVGGSTTVGVRPSTTRRTTSTTTTRRTTSTTTTRRTTSTTTTRRSTRPVPVTPHPPIINTPVNTPAPGFNNRCRAHPYYSKLFQSIDQWCKATCRPNVCPQYCLCS